MFPQPESSSEFRPDDSLLDSIRLLEQHSGAGLPPDLALDLVLNELVIRAAEATHASAAALALARGNQDELIVRAAIGHLAPDIGVPINTRGSLSGVCVQTGQAQLSVETESDPRIDPAVARVLGVHSILIVPVLDAYDEANRHMKSERCAGILEVYSTSPAAFSHNDVTVLEVFAEECARARQAAISLGQCEAVEYRLGQLKPIVLNPSLPIASQRKAAAAPPEPDFSRSEPRQLVATASPSTRRPTYEVWARVLGAVAVVASVAVIFLFGSRIGWWQPASPVRTSGHISASAISGAVPEAAVTVMASRTKSGARRSAAVAPSKSDGADELVVYEKGKVIFRMRPVSPNSWAGNPSGSSASKQSAESIIEASSTTKVAAFQSVWLSPTKAATRLLNRIEPKLPAEALADHRSGDVVLEVQVAEDGSVADIRALSGDPLLAAAAVEAVRNWRYEPYRLHDRATPFETDVTVSFIVGTN